MGLISWRDLPVPLIDLDQRLGEPSGTDLNRLLITRTGLTGEYLAFPVHGDLRVHALPIPHQPAPSAPEKDSSLVLGRFKIRERTVMIPDLHKIVTEG